MGRAARRQQERATRRQATRPAPARSGIQASPSMAIPAGVRTAPAPWYRPRWASDIISELRKVTWPTRQETTHLTIVVIVISILFAIVLGAADFAFSWIVEQTILR